MIKALLTPTHIDSLKPLLNQPLTSTFHHPRAQWELALLKLLVAHMPMMALKIRLYLKQGGERLALKEVRVEQ